VRDSVKREMRVIPKTEAQRPREKRGARTLRLCDAPARVWFGWRR
jgi:hypothetical protein